MSGADVRLLRMLAGCVSGRPSAEPTDFPHGQITDISSFLEHWLVIEARENQLSRSFRMVTDVQVNTALPYDLHVLKVRIPILRTIACVDYLQYFVRGSSPFECNVGETKICR